MGIIGKLFRDAGLRDLAVESGIIAEGSADAALEGRQYNRAVRLHKLVYETLMQMAWKGFLPWMSEHHPEALPQLEDFLDNLKDPKLNQEKMNLLLQSPIMQNCIPEYMEYLRTSNGSLSAFWVSYIDMVSILLSLLRASR